MQHFSLPTKGVLFLGASETPGDLSNEFVIAQRIHGADISKSCLLRIL